MGHILDKIGSWIPNSLLPAVRPVLWLADIWDTAWSQFWWWKEKRTMLKIAVVGDLSLQEPARLKQALDAALDAADVVIQVGDMHPGYDVVKEATRRHGKIVLAIPGNHDYAWDEQYFGWCRQWHVALEGPPISLVGMDNSKDSFCDADWKALEEGLRDSNRPLLVFCHKPLSSILLPDGSSNRHFMGEGQTNADAERLKTIISQHDNALLIHGHWHGHTVFKTWYADCLIEGRGGAAPEIGYTLILINEDGLVIHRVDL